MSPADHSALSSKPSALGPQPNPCQVLMFRRYAEAVHRVIGRAEVHAAVGDGQSRFGAGGPNNRIATRKKLFPGCGIENVKPRASLRIARRQQKHETVGDDRRRRQCDIACGPSRRKHRAAVTLFESESREATRPRRARQRRVDPSSGAVGVFPARKRSPKRPFYLRTCHGRAMVGTTERCAVEQ